MHNHTIDSICIIKKIFGVFRQWQDGRTRKRLEIHMATVLPLRGSLGYS